MVRIDLEKVGEGGEYSENVKETLKRDLKKSLIRGGEDLNFIKYKVEGWGGVRRRMVSEEEFRMIALEAIQDIISKYGGPSGIKRINEIVDFFSISSEEFKNFPNFEESAKEGIKKAVFESRFDDAEKIAEFCGLSNDFIKQYKKEAMYYTMLYGDEEMVKKSIVKFGLSEEEVEEVRTKVDLARAGAKAEEEVEARRKLGLAGRIMDLKNRIKNM